jgi:hypothetical protein
MEQDARNDALVDKADLSNFHDSGDVHGGYEVECH